MKTKNKKDAGVAMKNNVNHPSHYNSGKIEVIEVIEDQQLGFHLGNAIKYILRAGKKDPAKTLEDLNKAKWYIDRFIEIQKPAPRRPNDMNPRVTVTATPKKVGKNAPVVKIPAKPAPR